MGEAECRYKVVMVEKGPGTWRWGCGVAPGSRCVVAFLPFLLWSS
jgi:hypothetical protein